MFYNIIVYVVYVALLPVYRLRVRGAENIPQGAAVVCGNHTARVDAVVVFLALFLHGNRPAIIAKAELFKNPLPGGSSLIWGRSPSSGTKRI